MKAHQAELTALYSASIPMPEPYANAEAVIQGARAKGGSVSKDDEGKCTLTLSSPDPELEEAFARHYEDIRKSLPLTGKEFLIEVEQIRLMAKGI